MKKGAFMSPSTIVTNFTLLTFINRETFDSVNLQKSYLKINICKECIYPALIRHTIYDTRSIFRQSKSYLNSKFSFSHTSFLNMVKEPSLPYNLPYAGGVSSHGLMPFPRALVPNKNKQILLDFNFCSQFHFLLWLSFLYVSNIYYEK